MPMLITMVSSDERHTAVLFYCWVMSDDLIIQFIFAPIVVTVEWINSVLQKQMKSIFIS